MRGRGSGHDSSQSRAAAPGTARVLAHLDAHAKVLQALQAEAGAIVEIAEAVTAALQAGHKLIAFGNGGSAADAEHFAAELVGRYVSDRPALPAIALTTNSSSLTALANDYGYGAVFTRQIEALGRPGDVAVGITTSGKSENVLRGLEAAKKAGLVTVALTGAVGVALPGIDFALAVPSSSTPVVQEAHIAAIHCICELVEQRWLVDGAR
jgi:D-sedoheptulose 7-phosphate isomerase